jgi:hypothetical protein
MSKYWTWAEVRTKIKRDLDIEDETFVREEELLGHVNEAIDEAEAEIHALYEDYFLKKETVTITAGTETYPLPDDIYAHKIRRIVYNNSSSVYTIDRIQDWKKFEIKSIADNFATSDLYQFFIQNPSAGAPEIVLVPKARDTGPFLEVWYLRNANRVESDTDIIDIPEFINFIFQKLTVLIMEKEGHPNLPKAEMDLEKERERMLGVLAQMVPDAKNEVEMDTSFYEEMN